MRAALYTTRTCRRVLYTRYYLSLAVVSRYRQRFSQVYVYSCASSRVRQSWNWIPTALHKAALYVASADAGLVFGCSLCTRILSIYSSVARSKYYNRSGLAACSCACWYSSSILFLSCVTFVSFFVFGYDRSSSRLFYPVAGMVSYPTPLLFRLV